MNKEANSVPEHPQLEASLTLLNLVRAWFAQEHRSARNGAHAPEVGMSLDQGVGQAPGHETLAPPLVAWGQEAWGKDDSHGCSSKQNRILTHEPASPSMHPPKYIRHRSLAMIMHVRYAIAIDVVYAIGIT